MLKLQPIVICCTAVFLLSLAVVFFFAFSSAYFFIFLLIFAVFLMVGAIQIRLNVYLHSITHCNTRDTVLLSFDDGPHPIYTPLLLDVLDRYKVKVVFCIIGKNAKKHPELIKDIHNRGHLLIHHSYSHSWFFPLLSVKKMLKEIQYTNEVIEPLIKEKLLFFRPPFGVTNPRISKMLKKSALISLAWSYRSFDTTSKSSEQIINEIKKRIKGGDILLFHDNLPNTHLLIQEILPYLDQEFKMNSIPPKSLIYDI